jgi:hypothetical protein
VARPAERRTPLVAHINTNENATAGIDRGVVYRWPCRRFVLTNPNFILGAEQVAQLQSVHATVLRRTNKPGASK